MFESEAEKARELESATHKALGHHIEHSTVSEVHEIPTKAEISEKALENRA